MNNSIEDDMNCLEWNPGCCIQEFYSEVLFTGHYGFYHKGHEYFITWDCNAVGEKVYVIYDRDLNDPLYFEKSSWDIEPRMEYPSLPDLCFCFELKNEGKTIADYICDFNGRDRCLFPEPIDKKSLGKKWQH